MLTTPLQASGKATDLLEMADQLDQIDKKDFQESIDRANACTRARNFSCSESELAKSAKAANSGQDKKTLAAARQNIANEKARIAEEERQRAEEERRVAAAEERQRREEEAKEERRQERERQAREEEDRQSAQAANNSANAQILNGINENIALLAPIQNQTNKFLAEQAVRDRQAAEERERVRAERNEREAERRRDAEQDRAARAEAQRAAREDAARSERTKNIQSGYGSSSTIGGATSNANNNVSRANIDRGNSPSESSAQNTSTSMANTDYVFTEWFDVYSSHVDFDGIGNGQAKACEKGKTRISRDAGLAPDQRTVYKTQSVGSCRCEMDKTSSYKKKEVWGCYTEYVREVHTYFNDLNRAEQGRRKRPFGTSDDRISGSEVPAIDP